MGNLPGSRITNNILIPFRTHKCKFLRETNKILREPGVVTPPDFIIKESQFRSRVRNALNEVVRNPQKTEGFVLKM